MIRTSYVRVDGFGAEYHTRTFDQCYEVRASVADPQRGPRGAVAAELIFRRQATLHSPVHARSLQNSLRTIHLHDATVRGHSAVLEPLTLRYNASWLAEPSSFLPDMWCNLHSLLATTPWHYKNKFDLMIWLSTAAFAESADMDVIQALAAFYNCPDLAPVEIPSDASFDLAEGDSPALSTIQNLVQIYQPYEVCPEYTLPRLPGEQYWQWDRRRRTLFEMHQSNAAKTFARALHNQWPCEVPSTPRTQFAETYLDTERAMSEVWRMFKIWYDNRCFYRYLENISSTLARQDVDPLRIRDNRVVYVRENCGDIHESSFYSIKDIFSLEAPASAAFCKSTPARYTTGNSDTRLLGALRQLLNVILSHTLY